MNDDEGRSLLRRALLGAALVISAAAPLGCKEDRAAHGEVGEVVLYAAASLAGSCDKLARAFEREHPGARVLTNYGASGALARQLALAPRADVFFSASEEYMNELERAGRLAPGTRRALLENQLVAVVSRGSRLEADKAEDLATLSFDRLFVADEQLVPAGKYAKLWLSSCAVGSGNVWDTLAPKRVPVADVRAALSQAEQSTDSIAIVYHTDALSSDKVRVLFERHETTGIPIVYPVARIARPDASPWAEALHAFLIGPVALAEFRAAGFRVRSD